ncbi:MAG: HEAT repeat domain-containing protein [Prevotella sp.]|nr:HEAT repeat domain-containing protein [Prevotella sp.]
MTKFNSLKEALEAFRKHAVIHGETQKNGKYKIGNRSHDFIRESIDYLTKNNQLEQLTVFLSAEDLSLRIWAAYALLHIKTKEAVRVLKEIAKRDKGIMGFNAEMTISEFKKGNI